MNEGKAILEFQLPEHRKSFDVAVYGMDSVLVICKIDQLLRHIMKTTETEEIQTTIEFIQNSLQSYKEEYGITHLFENL